VAALHLHILMGRIHGGTQSARLLLSVLNGLHLGIRPRADLSQAEQSRPRPAVRFVHRVSRSPRLLALFELRGASAAT
jgi:hypothetical protein